MKFLLENNLNDELVIRNVADSFPVDQLTD